MAIAMLAFRDLDDGLLPDVCAKCGTLATSRKSKLFLWKPSWITILILFGYLPYLLVGLILTKRRSVSVPFCEAHKNHWTWRTFTVLGSFAFVVAVWVAAIILLNYYHRGAAESQLAGALCFASVLLPVPWLIAALIIQNSAIQASEITDDTITLRNVARDFAVAYEEGMGDGFNRIVRDEWRQPEGRRPIGADDKIRKSEQHRLLTDAIEPE